MEFQTGNYFIIMDATCTHPVIITDSHGFIKYFNSYNETEEYIFDYKLPNSIICDMIRNR